MGKGGVRAAFFLLLFLPLLLFANGDLNAPSAPGSAWTLLSAGGRLTPEAGALLRAMRRDTTILCDKRRYRLDAIERLIPRAPADPEARTRLEAMLTDSFRLYRHDRTHGCLDPLAVYPEHLGIDRRDENLSEAGENLLLRRLVDGLHRYEAIARRGGWRRIDASFYLLKEGETDPAVPALKARLAVTGDFNGTIDANTTFGPHLAEAVRRFQARHGLKTDGIVGPNTLRWLNRPIEAKIETLRLNIERLRWLTGGSRDFIAVNIPAFGLTLYRDDLPTLSMRVVVGSRSRPTPMIRDTLTYAVLNPTWRAPKTIVDEDILPRLRAGRFDELRRKGIVAVRAAEQNTTVPFGSVAWERYNAENIPYIFLQRPGPLNYLGFVKFMFPNAFDVYLHDTNHDELFDLRNRARSSGCVRVQKPIELFHALADPDDSNRWRYKEIAEVLLSKKERLVGFKKPIPVYLLYLTAYVDDAGNVCFRKDLYGYDARMREFLNQL